VHQQTINAIAVETNELLAGRFLGTVFQLTIDSLALDFGLRGQFLLISVAPANPRLHLISRRLRDLEKSAIPHSAFVQSLRQALSDAQLISLTADPQERVVRLSFSQQDETGRRSEKTLLAQLTGRSANLLLLDSEDVILAALRPPKGQGQQIADNYRPPPPPANATERQQVLEQGNFPSLSAAADDYFARLDAETEFAARVQRLRDGVRRQIAQRTKLRSNLHRDIETHGDADTHKKIGDLLLANVATAERSGRHVRLKDYFAEGEPWLELEIEESRSLPEEAARYFSRYTKSKRAQEEIAKRLVTLEAELAGLEQQRELIERVAAGRDEDALVTLEGEPGSRAAVRTGGKRERTEKLPGVRRYRSSDGYEILVGKTARNNDHLTFKVARPHDLWLHAADYPGSHVIVRNAGRKEIPQRTVIEAAQLAAKFSQAGEDAKVDVHYAQRKFLSKPKGAAPGLVRMSSYHTLTVAPGENVQRLNIDY
jgi:predicted ribosome quality control (RQC) complex YloA/Tae2 family protein